MATHRTLVEAQAFHGRRLVTAFVSGVAEGRQAEPARPERSLLAGAALAGLLMAGAPIAGAVTVPEPDDWSKPGLLISRQGGADSVISRERR